MNFIIYDFWIGLYEDKVRKVFYICLLPCICFIISYSGSYGNRTLDKLTLYWTRLVLYIFIIGWWGFLSITILRILSLFMSVKI